MRANASNSARVLSGTTTGSPGLHGTGIAAWGPCSIRRSVAPSRASTGATIPASASQPVPDSAIAGASSAGSRVSASSETMRAPLSEPISNPSIGSPNVARDSGPIAWVRSISTTARPSVPIVAPRTASIPTASGRSGTGVISRQVVIDGAGPSNVTSSRSTASARRVSPSRNFPSPSSVRGRVGGSCGSGAVSRNPAFADSQPASDEPFRSMARTAEASPRSDSAPGTATVTKPAETVGRSVGCAGRSASANHAFGLHGGMPGALTGIAVSTSGCSASALRAADASPSRAACMSPHAASYLSSICQVGTANAPTEAMARTGAIRSAPAASTSALASRMPNTGSAPYTIRLPPRPAVIARFQVGTVCSASQTPPRSSRPRARATQRPSRQPSSGMVTSPSGPPARTANSFSAARPSPVPGGVGPPPSPTRVPSAASRTAKYAASNTPNGSNLRPRTACRSRGRIRRSRATSDTGVSTPDSFVASAAAEQASATERPCLPAPRRWTA